MALNLFISVCLAIAGTLVSAAFGLSSGICALIGIAIFVVYWIGLVIVVSLEDLF